MPKYSGLRLTADPLLVVAHDDHRHRRRRSTGVEPVQLRGGEVAGGRERDRRVEQGDGDAGQLDPLVAGVLLLTSVGVVVAAHDVEAVTERLAVALLERCELLRRCRRS